MVLKAFRELGMSSACSNLLTKLVTVQEPWPQLPQGFPTSPKVTALVLKKLEKRLRVLAEKYKWDITYWYDDISISGRTREKD